MGYGIHTLYTVYKNLWSLHKGVWEAAGKYQGPVSNKQINWYQIGA